MVMTIKSRFWNQGRPYNCFKMTLYTNLVKIRATTHSRSFKVTDFGTNQLPISD